MDAPQPKKKQGGRMTRNDEDERIAYAVVCIRATPDAYQQSKRLMEKFGVARRRAIKWLEVARERIRRNLDICWPTAAAECWHDVREAIAACRAKGDYANVFRGLDVAAKLMPMVKPGTQGGADEARVMTAKEVLECWAATTGVLPPDGNGATSDEDKQDDDRDHRDAK